MFGISQVMCFASNRAVTETTRTINQGQLRAEAAGQCLGVSPARVLPHISPLNGQVLPALPISLRNSSLRNSSMGASNIDKSNPNESNLNKSDFRGVAKTKALPMTNPEAFIAEEGATFFAAVSAEESLLIAKQETTADKPQESSLKSAAGVSAIDATLEKERVMISINDQLKDLPVSVIAQTLTAFLRSPEAGELNIDVNIVQHLSPSVLVADICDLNLEEPRVTPDENMDSDAVMSPGNDAKPGSPQENTSSEVTTPSEITTPSEVSAPTVSGRSPETLRLALSCLQRCQGVVAVESDHNVQSLSP